MIDLNLCIYYFDITIAKNYINRILRFKQTNYIEKFCINHDIIESTIILIFIINDKFYIVEDNFVIIKESHHVYQSVVDFLIYIILNTRLNIVFAILIISRYDSNFDISH